MIRSEHIVRGEWGSRVVTHTFLDASTGEVLAEWREDIPRPFPWVLLLPMIIILAVALGVAVTRVIEARQDYRDCVEVTQYLDRPVEECTP